MAKYTKRLDKSRDYGTYHPPENGAFYNQDGFDFDHEGQIVETLLSEEQKAQLAKKPAVPKPPHPAKPHKAAEVHEDERSPVSDQSADGLNLEAWLRGEEDYPFEDVRKAVKARYSVFKTSKRDLVLFLVEDQKLVETEQLSDELKSVIA